MPQAAAFGRTCHTAVIVVWEEVVSLWTIQTDAAKLMMTVMIKYTEKESVSLVPYGSGINDLDALAVLHQTTIVDVEFVSATEKQLVALPGQRMIKRTNLGVSETEGNINVWVLIK